jgi:hypothetical protein
MTWYKVEYKTVTEEKALRVKAKSLDEALAYVKQLDHVETVVSIAPDPLMPNEVHIVSGSDKI